MRFTTKRYSEKYPWWQFIVWLRQFIIWGAAVFPDVSIYTNRERGFGMDAPPPPPPLVEGAGPDAIGDAVAFVLLLLLLLLPPPRPTPLPSPPRAASSWLPWEANDDVAWRWERALSEEAAADGVFFPPAARRRRTRRGSSRRRGRSTSSGHRDGRPPFFFALHYRCHPFLYAFQNYVESGLFLASLLMLGLGTAYSAIYDSTEKRRSSSTC